MKQVTITCTHAHRCVSPVEEMTRTWRCMWLRLSPWSSSLSSAPLSPSLSSKCQWANLSPSLPPPFTSLSPNSPFLFLLCFLPLFLPLPSLFILNFPSSFHLPLSFFPSSASLCLPLCCYVYVLLCICLWLPFSPPLSPSRQAHQETFKQLLQHLYRLLQCRYIQEHDSDELRKDLDKCIKLLHNISKILIIQNRKK